MVEQSVSELEAELKEERDRSIFLGKLLKALYGEGWDKLTINEAKKWVSTLYYTMQHAKVFITSRQKMHPTGVGIYEDVLQQLFEARDLNVMMWLRRKTMGDKNVKLESIYETKVPKRKLLSDYWNKLPATAASLIRKVDLMRKRLRIK